MSGINPLFDSYTNAPVNSKYGKVKEAKNLKVQADVDNNAITLEFKGQGAEAYKAVIVGPKAEGKTFDFNGYSVYARSNGSGELTAATPLAASTVLIAKK